MLALAEAARRESAGHPLWHYLVIAGVAVGVFCAIKLKELIDEHRRTRVPDRPIVETSADAKPTPAGLPAPAPSIVVLAIASLLSGGIHAAVSGEHFREAFIFGAFFTVAAGAQIGWALLLLNRPNRALLALGAVGNAAVIALWTASRTVGLPIGPERWHPEAIGALDVVSTLFEVVIVIIAVTLLVRRPHRADDVVERRLAEFQRQYPTAVRPPEQLRETSLR